MKRFLLFTSLLVSTWTISFAQASVSTGHPSLSVDVKRCFANGQNVYVDMIFTVNNNWDRVVLENASGDYASFVFDDEGNSYTNKFYFEIDGKSSSYQGWIDIAPDVPRKMRLVISNVDEYASSLSLIKLSYSGGYRSTSHHNYIIIKKLPISR